MSMLRTTVFRALAAIFAGLICPEHLPVVMAWNNVGLTSNTWNPEAVDNVVRYQVNLNHGTLRYVERICCDNILVGIVKLPPPLVPNRLHLKTLPRTGNIL